MLGKYHQFWTGVKILVYVKMEKSLCSTFVIKKFLWENRVFFISNANLLSMDCNILLSMNYTYLYFYFNSRTALNWIILNAVILQNKNYSKTE
jgi:ABC-type antimicrobial peptide transport system permease subunit